MQFLCLCISGKMKYQRRSTEIFDPSQKRCYAMLAPGGNYEARRWLNNVVYVGHQRTFSRLYYFMKKLNCPESLSFMLFFFLGLHHIRIKYLD